MPESIYDTKAARYSRTAYIFQYLTEYLVTLLFSDAFLAKLMTSMGIDDATIGILSSMLNLTILIQLAVIPLMARVRSYKRIVVLFDTLSVFLYFIIYLLPFLPASRPVLTVLTFLFMTAAPLCKYFCNSMYISLVYSYVDPKKRGRFSSLNCMVALVGGIVLSLAAAAVIDRYEAAGNLKGAFLIIAAFLLLSVIVDLILLLLIRDNTAVIPSVSAAKDRGAVRELFRNSSYRLLLLFECIESFALYITVGFLGTYKTGELMYSVWTIQLITSLGKLGRTVFSMPFGSYSDRHSAVDGYILGMTVIFFGFLCLVFTSPALRWLIIPEILLHNIGLCGGINQTNMVYDYVPEPHVSEALALRSALTGVVAFVAALAGSAILRAVQNRGNLLFGMTVYGQQLLAVISCVLLLLNIFLTRHCLRNRTRIAS